MQSLEKVTRLFVRIVKTKEIAGGVGTFYLPGPRWEVGEKSRYQRRPGFQLSLSSLEYAGTEYK